MGSDDHQHSPSPLSPLVIKIVRLSVSSPLAAGMRGGPGEPSAVAQWGRDRRTFRIGCNIRTKPSLIIKLHERFTKLAVAGNKLFAK
ncbi:hypothetical protein EVAR_88319_1 [Eumeta japonica]|uniref:Uncharacterized protein n=1 Tax=Eumeta variegata TaxID=151549 RepID=A0A4C1VN91_EUMVA|nr:hypothetical protein EVAR_88319_1 [Eumeta japonica]